MEIKITSIKTISMKDIIALYCFIDDFYKAVESQVKYLCENENDIVSKKAPTRVPELTISEILTIFLYFYQNPFKNFKRYYQDYIQVHYSKHFNLPSYPRFITLQPRVMQYLLLLLKWFTNQAEKTGISYIDSTKLQVCHNKRINRNKVFKGYAERGVSSMGYFYGFKLHMVINEKGEICDIRVTTGNTDDRAVLPDIMGTLTGLLFGDKGYISENVFKKLFDKGIKLVTSIRKNMKNKLVIMKEKILLRKRSIIETSFGILKEEFGIEHSRGRSAFNYFMHIIGALIGYSFKEKKPSIKINNYLSETIELTSIVAI